MYSHTPPSPSSPITGSCQSSPGVGGDMNSGIRRLSRVYSVDDMSHPHNDPSFQSVDEADAKANGVTNPYGMWMMWACFINYIIDTGALGVPYAFVRSGWLLSIIVLIASGIMSTITVIYTLETMARTTGILEWKERQDKRWRKKKDRRDDSFDSDVEEGDEDIDEYKVGEVEEEKEVLEELGESLRVNRAINPEAAKYGSFLAESPLLDSNATPSSADQAFRDEHSPMQDDQLLPLPLPDIPLSPNTGTGFPPSPGSSNDRLLPPNTPSPGVGLDGSFVTDMGSSTVGGATSSSSHEVADPISHDEKKHHTGHMGDTLEVPSSLTASTSSSRSPPRLHERPRSSSDALKTPPPKPHSQQRMSVGSAGMLPTETSHLRGASSGSINSGRATPTFNPIAGGRGYPITSPAHEPEHVGLVLHNKPIHHLSYRRTDFTLMSQLFGGYPLTILTQFSITIFSFVCLWVSAAIFAQSCDTLYFQYVTGTDCNIYVAHQSVGCYNGYYIMVGIYSVIVIYISLKDLSETATMQAILTGYRFSAFFAMGLTCLIASLYPNYFDSPDGKHPATWSPFNNEHAATIPTYNWSEFDSIFTIAAVSLMVQYNMPDIITPMKTPFKRHTTGVISMLLGAMILCVALYAGLGLICSLTIGNSSYPLITLNWTHYTGWNGGWGLIPVGENVQWWAVVVKLFIMLFPVINMISVFPLVAISLSENLRSSIPDRYAKQHSVDDLKFYCRIFACVPPLILTCFYGQIDLIFKVAGFVAFLIQLIIPCLLQWTSIRYCTRIWGPGSESTPFSFPVISNPFSVVIVFIISSLAAIYSIVAMSNEADA